MEMIRYYTYLETLKKLTGEIILFDNTAYGDDCKVKLLGERYDRILGLLKDKGYLEDSLFEGNGSPDSEDLYSNVSLLMTYLRERRK